MIVFAASYCAMSASVAMVLIAGGLLFALYRLIRGPSLPDRVVALDLIGLLTIGLIAAHTVSVGEAMLLDSASVLALVSFVGTVAFARYLSQVTKNE